MQDFSLRVADICLPYANVYAKIYHAYARETKNNLRIYRNPLKRSNLIVICEPADMFRRARPINLKTSKNWCVYIEKKLDNRFTCQQILSTLRTFQFALVPGDGYLPLYERSELTDALHDAFGFRTDFQIVTINAMKKILKSTKT